MLKRDAKNASAGKRTKTPPERPPLRYRTGALLGAFIFSSKMEDPDLARPRRFHPERFVILSPAKDLLLRQAFVGRVPAPAFVPGKPGIPGP